jgi:hypothetical protein
MTGYRVAVGEPELSPFAVDEELAARQRKKQMVVAHSIGVFISVGIWLPVLVYVALFGLARARAAVKGYTVRIAEGQLFVGTRENNSMVPLDQIQSISSADGVLTVAVTGRPQGLRIEGLVDPLAASSAILRARDEKTRVRATAAVALAEEAVAVMSGEGAQRSR